jgi:hypothetical protein
MQASLNQPSDIRKDELFMHVMCQAAAIYTFMASLDNCGFGYVYPAEMQ